jgi:hypothetical protein
LFGAGAGAALAGSFFAGALFRVVCAGNIAHTSASMANHVIPSWYGTNTQPCAFLLYRKDRPHMSRLENIEGQVTQLSPEELGAFRNWFLEFDANQWDHQFESDVKNGRLNELAAKALRDHEAGRSTEL